MRFLTFEQAASHLRGLRVVVVGSAPSVLENEPGFIDGHDVVVRVNNWKAGERQGSRCDVFYSFFGTSIRKSAEDLVLAGVKLCWCKCPDAKPLSCEWHERNGKTAGIDFRYIYRNRAGWWPCDTYVPSEDRFLRVFEMLGRHIPTTGFSAIIDALACDPASVHVTGFDFFTSGIHNVDEAWKPGDPADPIGHRPDIERAWLARNASAYPLTFDRHLQELLA